MHFAGVLLFKSFCGYGISTVCASATPLGLTLAPDLLGADEPSSKNLRLSANMILTYFALLIPAFSLLHGPPTLPLRFQSVQNALLPFSAILQPLNRFQLEGEFSVASRREIFLFPALIESMEND